MSHGERPSGIYETKIVGKLSKKATENKSFIVEMNISTKEEPEIEWSRLADEDDDNTEGITPKADNVEQDIPSKTDNSRTALRGIPNRSINKKKLENLAAKGVKQYKINPIPNLTSARSKEETKGREQKNPRILSSKSKSKFRED